MFYSQWTISLNNLLVLEASAVWVFFNFSRASSQQPWWESDSLLPLQLISKGPSMLYVPGKQVLEISFNVQPCKTIKPKNLQKSKTTNKQKQLRGSPEHRAWLGWKWSAGALMMEMCCLGYPHGTGSSPLNVWAPALADLGPTGILAFRAPLYTLSTNLVIVQKPWLAS